MDKYGPLTAEEESRFAEYNARKEYYKTHIDNHFSTPGTNPESGTFRGCFTK